jgi:uncharacterized delta-60 repeat protein
MSRFKSDSQFLATNPPDWLKIDMREVFQTGIALCWFLVTLLSLAQDAIVQPGSIDASWRMTEVQGGAVFRVMVQPDGSVVIGGAFSVVNGVERTFVAKLQSDGVLDERFHPPQLNLGGRTWNSYPVVVLVRQPDGKILVGGNISLSVGGRRTAGILRLNTDGSADEGFAPKGGTDESVRIIQLYEDGRILIGGDFNKYGGTTQPKIARLLPDGTLDVTFSVKCSTGAYVTTALLHKDESIVLTGEPLAGRILPDGSTDPLFQFRLNTRPRVVHLFPAPNESVYAGSSSFFSLTRLNATGTPDSGFVSHALVDDVAFQSDGKIVVGGGSSVYAGRLLADGERDTSFQASLPLSGNDQAFTVAVQPDGRILVGGRFPNSNGTNKLGVVRFNGGDLPGAPFVRQQPELQVIPQGADAEFHPSIEGTEPILFQWKKDGKPISGETNVTLHMSNCQSNQLGTYSLVASNAFGLTSTRPVGLFLAGPPALVLQPSAWTVYSGTNLELRVAAESPVPIWYQWRQDGTALAHATNASLLLENTHLADSGFYDVEVSNRFGFVLSQQAPVIILPPNAPGAIDTNFIVRIPSPGSVSHLELLPNGRLLVAGQFSSINGLPRPNLVRVDLNGQVDLDFEAPSVNDAQLSAVAVQPDGRVVLAGNVNLGFIARVWRLTTNGSVDESFAVNQFLPSPGSWVTALALQPDGKILVAGSFDQVQGARRLGVARLNADGTLDEGFQYDPGSAGISQLKSGVAVVVFTPDGHAILGGSFTNANQSGGGVLRLLENGNLDPTFVPDHDYSKVLSLLPARDGRLMLGGFLKGPNSIVRLDEKGGQDATYNADVVGDFGSTLYGVFAMVQQVDGKIIFGGNAVIAERQRMRVARLNPDGSLDRSFLAPQLGYLEPHALALLPNGDLIIGGYAVNSAQPPLVRVFGGALEGYPTITQEPEDQIVNSGKTITIEVIANGLEPLSYQWAKDGVPLVNATTTTLAITNFGAANTGGYSVTVSNVLGGVRSRFISLQYSDLPGVRFTSTAIHAGVFELQFSCPASSDYTLESSEDFQQWKTLLSTNTPAGVVNFGQPLSSGPPTRYFRVRLEAEP